MGGWHKWIDTLRNLVTNKTVRVLTDTIKTVRISTTTRVNSLGGFGGKQKQQHNGNSNMDSTFYFKCDTCNR